VEKMGSQQAPKRGGRRERGDRLIHTTATENRGWAAVGGGVQGSRR
jgi:hypothetical protein